MNLNPFLIKSWVCAICCLKSLVNLWRDYGLRELAHAFEPVISENGHQTRDDWDCDPCGPTVSDPVVKDVVVVKELSDDEVCASVDFLFEVSDVIFS